VKYVLYFYIGTYCSMCAVPNMAVFCNSLISCFPGMLHRYFLSDFEMVPVAPIFTSVTLLHALNCYYKVFPFSNVLSFFLVHIFVSRNCNIYLHACSFFIIMEYDVRFIVRCCCHHHHHHRHHRCHHHHHHHHFNLFLPISY